MVPQTSRFFYSARKYIHLITYNVQLTTFDSFFHLTNFISSVSAIFVYPKKILTFSEKCEMYNKSKQKFPRNSKDFCRNYPVFRDFQRNLQELPNFPRFSGKYFRFLFFIPSFSILFSA